MFFIQGKNIGYKYEERQDSVFVNLNFTIDHTSRIGLIGNNGCGKSTLIKILGGIISDYSGCIANLNRLKAGYLPQEAAENQQGSLADFLWLAACADLAGIRRELLLQSDNADLWNVYADLDGFDFEIKIDSWLDRFGLAELPLDQPFNQLSGGEKTKAALIRVLLTEPDWLLLDEPTNHLDEEHLDWLENFLLETRLPYIIISHDRRFLDSCTKTIWEIHKGGLQEYGGNYSLFKQEKEEEFARKTVEYQQAKRKISKLKETFQMLKQGAETHQPSTGTEGNSVTYNCVTNFAKYAMQKAKNVEHRMEKMIEKAESEKPFIEKKRKISFQENSRENRTVLTVKNLFFAYADQQILADLSLKLVQGDKIAVTGANGSGKSTLLKILAGQLAGFDGEIIINNGVSAGYYAQEYENLDYDKTILEEVLQGDNLKQTQARTILGCLKVKEELVNSKISTLSSGEKSKTALARLLVANPDLLILDEPTNHLEIEARENLEKALKEYTGTLILVCHDRRFREAVAGEEFKLEMDKNHEYT